MSRIIRSTMRRMVHFMQNTKNLLRQKDHVVFGGRLGEYKYYDMDAVIASALDMCEKELA